MIILSTFVAAAFAPARGATAQLEAARRVLATFRNPRTSRPRRNSVTCWRCGRRRTLGSSGIPAGSQQSIRTALAMLPASIRRESSRATSVPLISCCRSSRPLPHSGTRSLVGSADTGGLSPVPSWPPPGSVAPRDVVRFRADALPPRAPNVHHWSPRRMSTRIRRRRRPSTTENKNQRGSRVASAACATAVSHESAI